MNVWVALLAFNALLDTLALHWAAKRIRELKLREALVLRLLSNQIGIGPRDSNAEALREIVESLERDRGWR